MRDTETITRLARTLDFNYNPENCSTSSKPDLFSIDNRFAISEVNERRYVEFAEERYNKPPYNTNPEDCVLDQVVSDEIERREWSAIEDDFVHDPDEDHDRSLHGLVINQRGHVALYSPFRWLGSFYRFRMVNGSGGMNRVNSLLGRFPGIDIPEFVPGGDDQRSSTAGEIVEAMADMKMIVPGVNDFFMIQHDLGYGLGNHGTSWPNTHPLVYKHLSRVAQDIIEEHGESIHGTTSEELDNRPPDVVKIARTLDALVDRLSPNSKRLAVMELRIRDGRYDDVDDIAIANDLLRLGFNTARWQQVETANNFLVSGAERYTASSYRMGYWIGMQLVSGVIETRLALHEVQPHPEATVKQTLRALNILSILKKEVDRRLEENKNYTLAA